MVQKNNMDTLLEAIESPKRREILDMLSKEKHYPLQLSKELGISPQAVMKHLKVLEKCGLVACTIEKSTLGGPPRKAYSATKRFSISIDVGPAAFRSRLHLFDEGALGESSGELAEEFSSIRQMFEEIDGMEKAQTRIAKARELLFEIEREISDAEERRDRLVQLRRGLLEDVYDDIRSMGGEYSERRFLYDFFGADGSGEAMGIFDEFMAQLEGPEARKESMEGLLKLLYEAHTKRIRDTEKND